MVAIDITMVLLPKIIKKRIRAQLSTEERITTGRILKLARLKAKMQQAEFAKYVGLSQAAISFIESGKREISAGLYRDIKKEFQISEIEWDLGIIDSGNAVEYVEKVDFDVAEICGLPDRYSTMCGSSVRACIPLIECFISVYGEEKWRDFLKIKGFKLDGQAYFYNYDNPINLNFSFDLISAIGHKMVINSDGITELTQSFSKKRPHGCLCENYLSKENSIELIESLILNANKYDVNTNYILADINKHKDLTVIVKANEHLKAFGHLKPDFYPFMGLYKKEIIKNFSKLNNRPSDISVELTEDWNEKNDRWIYTISANN